MPELGTSVFIVPGQFVKNGEDRLVVLNRIALSIVVDRRGKHQTHVLRFSRQAGLPDVEQRMEGGSAKSRSTTGSGA